MPKTCTRVQNIHMNPRMLYYTHVIVCMCVRVFVYTAQCVHASDEVKGCNKVALLPSSMVISVFKCKEKTFKDLSPLWLIRQNSSSDNLFHLTTFEYISKVARFLKGPQMSTPARNWQRVRTLVRREIEIVLGGSILLVRMCVCEKLLQPNRLSFSPV